jgi:cell division septation protein DedD
MADQLTSDDLSPQLSAVLSSLNVSLEAELNRYRRNRVVGSRPAADPFADLAEVSFDLNRVESLTAPSVSLLASQPANSSAIVSPAFPPPLPLNKRLSPALSPDSSISAAVDALSPSAELAGSLAVVSADATYPERHDTANPSSASAGNASGYLDSSEKLIDSLAEVPSMPDPIKDLFKPRRKTVSLLAGAILGLLGLVAGLGASYMMSNPGVAQRLANGLKGEKVAIAPVPTQTFDPPGPDLSAREFVDIKLDNLSSLKMPQAAVDPLATPTASSTAPSTATTLPPTLPPIANQPTATQSVTLPAGSNYYVTVPFTTEQNLLEIRKSVEEAFVRQFTDGNRVQLAAFDSLESAQQFIDEVKATGITAQIYGPTNE